MIKAVVIAGGTGTRLWPLSRAAYPKQFLAMYGDHTMLQATFKRLENLEVKSSITICNEEHRFLVAEQLRQIGEKGSIILEPVGRNTAPAIALAAFARPENEDPLLLVLPADHLIQDKAAFTKAVQSAVPFAESGKLVTFGVVAHEPNTAYGYIKKGKPLNSGFALDAFVEKPHIKKAKVYTDSGDFFWNSGIFLFRASRYLEQLQKYRPDIYEACNLSTKNIVRDNDFFRVDGAAFSDCPSESIDYAVMEKTDEAVVVPIDANWSDVGSWSSLWDINRKDQKDNVVSGDIILHDVNNSYLRTDGKLLAAVGVSDLVVVATKDAIMVANKDRAQDTKIIVEKLKDENRTEWELNREVFRPWGKYESLDIGSGYQVKRLTVNPGAKLSVQMHKHRAEHWIVVSGVAKVTRGDEEFLLSVNESTYIPLGAIHSLENPGKVPLELIEVQSGEYLGEDDIVRFEDRYGR